MKLLPILRLLADGEFHSGVALAKDLGVSRGAIWKSISGLETLGLKVDAVKGKGYRLSGGLELLDREQLMLAVHESGVGADFLLDVFDVVDSTNAVALSQVRAGRRTGYACLAEWQTAGRGRRGRAWVSPFGTNIYLSMVREFSRGFSAIDGLSLATGVAVCEALESVGLGGVGLKWPNDIVCADAKLGGILIEVTGDLGAACQAVVGVGVNVAMPESAAAAIDQRWTDLARLGLSRGHRNRLASELLVSLLRALDEFDRHGFAAFAERWRRLDMLVGREVIVRGPEADITGRAMGVDAAGALIVSVDGRLLTIRGGEVSVRPAA